ncbi:MAG: nucleophile aminohydrolase [Linnemannia gamsii]|nr:MAG: nucleophile aminohydrolase [Linnemannia gamsii]
MDTTPQGSATSSTQSPRGFVAVHVGAGHHAAVNKTRYLDACKRACIAGIELLRQSPKPTSTTTGGVSAAEVVECMIRILEDDPVTNAGTGSNLNLDGQVECDASIMDGTSLGFGSVGAVSDFKNPISVAAKILQESDQGPLSLGRIPPIMLVGPGVAQWVDTMVDCTSLPIQSGLERVARQPSTDALTKARERMLGRDIGSGDKVEAREEDRSSIGGSLVTMEALHRYVRFQTMLKKAATTDTTISLPSLATLDNQPETMDIDISRKRSRTETSAESTTGPNSQRRQHVQEEILEMDDEDRLQDTVGAICIDAQGRVAAGVSSGGIAMKFPGRVSEAALFGAGCWAQDATEDVDGFACSLTGAGEQITKTLLARTCMETCLSLDDLSDAANQVLDRFMTNPLLRGFKEKHAGWIGVRVDREALEIGNGGGGGGGARAEMVFAHTTQTMGVGYMSVRDSKPTAIMSKKNPGSSKVISTRMVKL